MPRGGFREGAGRKRTRFPSRIAKGPLPADAPLQCKRGRKPGQLQKIKPTRIARDTVEARIRELIRRGDEPSKAEAARLAVQLLPYEEPRLQAIMAQTEHKVTYVARLPEPIQSVEEWTKLTAPLLLPNK